MSMSQNAFITVVDTTLVNLIWDHIKNESATKNIILSPDQISLTTPISSRIESNKKLSIFLYSINQETTNKNIQQAISQSEEITTRTPFALQYLLTPTTGNEKDDHTLLENIINLLLATPYIGQDNGNMRFKVQIDSFSKHDLSKIWIALGTPLRLSVSLTVFSAETKTSPLIQQRDQTKIVQRSQLYTKDAVQLYQNVLKTFTEQSEGWKSRNLVLKQWVLQDFKKNTDVSVDEMLTALNGLGDRLKQDEPTNEFIKPLNKLTIFYQHQFDQLKELRKVSSKQRENLETISGWIKDVKALIEILSS